MNHSHRRDAQGSKTIKDLLPEACAFVLLHKGSPKQFRNIGTSAERFFACAGDSDFIRCLWFELAADAQHGRDLRGQTALGRSCGQEG